jgi:hypothetical protein
MPNRATMTLMVVEIGCMAEYALVDAPDGRVAAVFERSFYLDLADRWLCVTANEGLGPLAMTTRSPSGSAGRIGAMIVVGDPVRAAQSQIRIGSRCVIDVSHAQVWRPVAYPDWSDETVEVGLDAVVGLARRQTSKEGLGVLAYGSVCDIADLALARSARPALVDLGRWFATVLISANPRIPPPTLLSLVGLGPGLTPSGDDFLSGAMISAHALARPGVAGRMYAAIAPELKRLTHPISAAHLTAAADGLGGAAFHRVLGHTLAGNVGCLPDDIAALTAIGHSSGWDALAGMTFVLRAWLGRNVFSLPELPPLN